MNITNPIFCAIDTTDVAHACALARQIAPHIGGLKIGMEFFYNNGVAGYQALAELGLPIFLDLKLHDIPNTVAHGLAALLPLKPAIINIHISGGREMMKAARACVNNNGPHTMLIGVSILTSLDTSDLSEQGIHRSPSEQVVALARQAQDCGLDGIVCSAHEITAIRQNCGPEFKLIVPGIRPAGAQVQDQKRVMTPAQACADGADILVIGRPITQSADPAKSAAEIAKEIGR